MRFKHGVGINRTHKNGKVARYLRISAGPLRGKYVHTLIMEAKLGRKLRKDETVEHRDGNGLNCAIRNLTVVSRPENSRLMRKRLTEPDSYAVERARADLNTEIF